MWNYSHPEAAAYFANVVVMGENGVGSHHVDGMFLDDPGPSTSEHPMQEYTHTSGQIAISLRNEYILRADAAILVLSG